jgi:hypothetical protein
VQYIGVGLESERAIRIETLCTLPIEKVSTAAAVAKNRGREDRVGLDGSPSLLWPSRSVGASATRHDGPRPADADY